MTSKRARKPTLFPCPTCGVSFTREAIYVHADACADDLLTEDADSGVEGPKAKRPALERIPPGSEATMPLVAESGDGVAGTSGAPPETVAPSVRHTAEARQCNGKGRRASTPPRSDGKAEQRTQR
eukprot:CAMPEP_0119408726 /NCGR_PEP_ID=MMETSP1335-20130426/2199_1 /TAXON_ID=259385 /ORGANISM="Chrysoculter rhomboideus, Strain RCC1486" /LENGTH=124 /DNA_ID=CAMNT_0007433003 /DNA_START=53 /DNA_END=423 /DNA_ORIENTATION=-